MKIKKQLKKEKNRSKRLIFFSIFIMVLIPYIVVVLKDQGIFKGWQIYFVYLYLATVEILLIINITKIIYDSKYDVILEDGKIKIKAGILSSLISIPLDKIVYIDVSNINEHNFEILIIIEKGKRNKKFQNFNKEFIRKNDDYKMTYHYLKSNYENMDFYYYIIRRAGAKKYYYLYLIYKNAYGAEFSEEALNYLKMLMEEYNLA